jgi:hypothetical protein
MTDRNKNIRRFIVDLFRYQRDELSGRERNSFEKELQKDPFSEEASEGFSALSQENALRDITNLQKRLRKRTARGRKIIFFRIAASVAILMLISMLLIYIGKDKSSKQLAENSVEAPKEEVNKSISPAESDKMNLPLGKPEGSTERKPGTPVSSRKTRTETNNATSLENNLQADIRKDDSIQAYIPESAEIVVTDEKKSVPVTTMARARSSISFSARGKVISSDDNLPIPGVNIIIKGTKTGAITDTAGNFSINLPDSSNKTLIADFIGMERKEIEIKPNTPVEIRLNQSLSSLDEIVVTGYGVRKSDSENEDISTDHISAHPVTGKLKYEKYIQDNLHRPDSLTTGKMVVVLSFIVRKDGSIDSIKIIRSPGRLYSDEAIRVLRTGPGWKPAEDGGNPVEENVRLRIVFR